MEIAIRCEYDSGDRLTVEKDCGEVIFAIKSEYHDTRLTVHTEPEKARKFIEHLLKLLADE